MSEIFTEDNLYSNVKADSKLFTKSNKTFKMQQFLTIYKCNNEILHR